MGAGWRIVIINANGNIQNILDIGINDQLFLTADHTDGYCWVSYYTGGQIFKIDSTGSVVVAAKPYTNPRAVSLGYEE
jgi:hypothetical protein